MKKVLIYLLVFSPLFAFAQDNVNGACTVSFSGSNYGSVFSGNQNVTVKNEYVIPVDELEGIVEDLKRLEKLKKEVAEAQSDLEQKRLLDKAREENIETKETELLQKENKLNSKEKHVNQSKEQLEKNKENFNQKIAQAKTEFEIYLKKLENNTQETPKEIKEEVAELTTRGKNIIKGANCLAEDYEVYEMIDENGTVTYGFSLEELKNDPNYVFIDEYKEGLARVKKFNKYGFIDRNGKVVIDYIYDYAESFSDSLALVKNLGKVFFIDYQENKIIEGLEKYEKVSSFQYGVARVTKKEYSKEKTALMNKRGIVISNFYDEIYEFNKYKIAISKNKEYSSDEYGLINNKGKIVIGNTYDFAEIKEIEYHNTNNIDVIKIKSPTQSSYYDCGLISIDGDLLLEIKYKSISDFDQYRIAQIEDDDKYGLFSLKGGVILEPCYTCSQILDFDQYGIAKVRYRYTKNTDWYGLVNLKGELILRPSPFHDQISDFNQYGIAKIKNDDNYGLVNIEGKVLEPDYRSISDFNKNGIAVVKKSFYGIHYGVVDKNLEFILEPIYSEISDFDQYGIAKIKKHSNYGLVDIEGKFLEANYKSISDFDKNGNAILQDTSSKYGIIDNNLEFILEPKYNHISKFSQDVAVFKSGWSKVGILNTKGKIIKKLRADYISQFSKNGIAGIIFNEEEWGIIDKNGKVISKYKGNYSSIASLDAKMDNKEIFKVSENGYKWGMVNDKGKEILKPLYNEINYTSGKFIKVQKGNYDNFGLLSKEEEVVLNYEFKAEDINISEQSYKENNLYGLFTENGKVTEAKYIKVIEGFKNDAALIQGEQGQGAVDTKGREFIPLIFTAIERLSNNIFKVTYKNEGTFEVDKNGDCLSNCKEYREILKKYYADK